MALDYFQPQHVFVCELLYSFFAMSYAREQAVARGKETRKSVAACGTREEFKQKRTENKAATKVHT